MGAAERRARPAEPPVSSLLPNPFEELGEAGTAPQRVPLRRRLHRLLLRQGTAKACFWVTLFITTCSVAVTVAMNLVIGPPPQLAWLTYTLSLVTPLLISPPIAWFVMRLMLETDAARRLAERMAITDPLTGAYNRRQFFRVGELVLARQRGESLSLSVLLLDIDHFKAVNDQHGHAVGDQVLTAVARACARHLREGDLLARFGGEEFVVLLPATAFSEAGRVAERLRTAVASLAISADGIEPVRPTVSVGAASSAAQGSSLDLLIADADQAMYGAKHGGRNRVVAVESGHYRQR